MLIPLGFLAGSGGAAGSDYELIESVVLGSPQSSITFSGLGTYSSTYKHLQVRYAARSSVAQTGMFSQFNGDTSSNYKAHYVLGSGSSVISGYLNPSGQVGLLYSTDASANQFGPGVIELLDAFSTSKNKTVRGLSASQSAVILMSMLWINTSSLTSWQLTPPSGNFATGTRVSLYGIKG